MVIKSVPAGSTVVGNPARLITRSGSSFICQQSIFIPFKHSTSTNAACIPFLFRNSSSTKATYYETGFPCLSSPLPIHEKNSMRPGDDLWMLMKQQVKLEVEQEPLLSEYYFSTILAHNSMEGALANSLSLKLSQCRRIAHDLLAKARKTLALLIQNRVSEIFAFDIHPGAKVGKGISLDHSIGIVIGETSVIGNNVTILHSVMLGGTGKVPGDRHPKIGTYALGNISVQNDDKIGAGSMVIKSVPAGSTVVGQCRRIAHDLLAKARKTLALLIQNRVSEIFAFDIHPGAKVGKGISLDHSIGIVIGETSVIGNNVTILHSVMLGGTGKVPGDRHPKIGTCALGNISVQNDDKIGAGSMVIKSVPAGSTVVGNPARLITRSGQCRRIAHDLLAKARKTLALLIQNRVSEIFAFDIHLGAKVGKGISLDHSIGIVIGETSVIGNNVTILHSVMLGGTGKVPGDRHPKIGEGVVIWAGTCALGNICVKNDAKIGAGLMVLKLVLEVLLNSSFTKATYSETGFPCLSSPLPIPEKNSKSRGDDLWMLMKEEVKLDVEQEPLLLEYYFSTIFAHNSMEGALANSLSLKLSTSSLPSDNLYLLLLGVLTEDREIMEVVIYDLNAVKEKDPASISHVQCFFIVKGFLAGQCHRIAQDLWATARKTLALFIQNRVSEIFALDIHLGAKIGKGIFLDHRTGIVIGETYTIGNNVTILHNVTLGGTGKVPGDRHPKIGDGVVIGAGTCALGNIRVQNDAKIGAGLMVLKSVPAGSTVVGNPTRLIGVKVNTVKMVPKLISVVTCGTGKISGDRHPKIGDGVVIGAGTCVLGNIRVQNNAKIGAGSIVLKLVPAGSTTVGVLMEDHEIIEAVIDDLRAVKEKDPGSISHVQFFLIVKGFLAVGDIRVQNNAKIGAGSIVLNSVPAGSTTTGNPAGLIGVEVNPVKMRKECTLESA
ncbi:hypothetical protein BUALT_Bualt18G0027500 [Buddleja alternifolia]|uniref:serine O-acetyltransferase n=1 Tax=Buddleja alternifolia TaxID=168488 RepID=A0AAV6WAJ7_9LAMI|nr:hypothetical protein BUALT_Bualt18G0027500 [Buddleja alternifolia]